jgi:RepB DNA-primase from phage plasmid
MVDDVGTKCPRTAVANLPPTAIVETSPGNEQWWWFLAQPERDQEKFAGLIKAFIVGRLGGKDPGMAGVSRVGRLPGFTNGKPANAGWRCVLHDLNERRFTVEEIVSAFKLEIAPSRPPVHVPRSIARSRIEAFVTVKDWMRQRGWLKRNGQANPSGWIQVHCPWRGEHTGGADNGSAIREPARENSYYGAYVCSHGHCKDVRGWAELTDLIADISMKELAEINANPEEFERRRGWEVGKKPLPRTRSTKKLAPAKKKPPLGLSPRTALSRNRSGERTTKPGKEGRAT